MKFELIRPDIHKPMLFTGIFFAVLGAFLLWFFIWIKLHWIAMYYGSGTLLSGFLYILLAFSTETDFSRDNKYKLNQQKGLK